MRTDSLSWLVILTTVAVAPAVAEDKPSVRVISSSGTSVAGSGENSYGLSSASLLSVDHRPIACYGVTKGRKQPTRYSYLILFKAPANEDGKTTTFGLGGREEMTGAGIKATETPTVHYLGETKKWSYRYQLAANEDLTKVTTETLTIDGKEHKTSEGRVFLVDLTADKSTCRALKVEMPTDVPPLSGKGDGATIVEKAVADLKARSTDVRDFLKAGAK